MLQHAWERGVPMRWVTGDEVYGDASYLRETISRAGRWYVLAVAVSTPVWLQRPEVESRHVGTAKTGGRPRKKARLAKGAPPPIPVGEVVATGKASRWKRLTAAQGEKGPRRYDWTCQRVVESREGLPGEAVWLLARRSISPDRSGGEIAYYLSNAPVKVPLRQLARVALTRYTIEQCFEEAKGETGLDQYEVRYWHSWHRHITLSMMAHTWLAMVRLKMHKKGQRPPSLRN